MGPPAQARGPYSRKRPRPQVLLSRALAAPGDPSRQKHQEPQVQWDPLPKPGAPTRESARDPKFYFLGPWPRRGTLPAKSTMNLSLEQGSLPKPGAPAQKHS